MEGDTLDFKRDQYRLESDQQKAGLVKDIICMANTPRDEPAYILIGVTDKSGRAGDVVGTSEHPDPVIFQNLIRGNVNPPIQFSYRAIRYLSVEVGLFEIPVDQNLQTPVMATRRLGNLIPGVIYFRRSAQNGEAGPHEIKRITDWFSGRNYGPDVEQLQETSWETFYRACDEFDPARVYIAVVGEGQNLESANAEVFSEVGWQLVVDFNQATIEDGIYSKVEPFMSKRKSLRLTALDESLSAVSPTTSVWVAAKGLTSLPSTIQANTWREWNHVKYAPLSRVIDSVAQATEPNPVTAVVLGGEAEYLRTVCELLDRAFKDRLNFVFASEASRDFPDWASKLEATEALISLPAICSGLRLLAPPMDNVEDILLPAFDGGVANVPPDRARFVEEEVEIVHVNVGLNSANTGSELKDFLRGQPVSWHGLNLGVDVQRTVTPRLENRIRDELTSRTTRRLNLGHWPGGGGSTVARRIAWNIHNQYPTLLAKRVVPEPLVERLRYIFGLTQMPLLVIVEDSVTNSDDLDRVYDRLRSENIPVVLLRVVRGERASTQVGSFFLDGMLDNVEASAFAGRLIAEVPSRRMDLERLRDENSRQRRTPFYFGLVAFGKDFAGLEPYVSHRLREASEPVLFLCRISSLLYHFGQQTTPTQLLSSIFSLPRSKLVTMSTMMPGLLQELFVLDSDRSIRPAHELIANEILEQVLSRDLGDRRNWRSGLAQCSVDAIETASVHNDHPGGAVAELLRSVITERGFQETSSGTLEGQFSDLIATIPSSDGQLRVLKRLTELFPGEPHFWAHLGRFYTRVLRNHAEAHLCHEESLLIAPDDPVLHHMAGTALRGEVYELLEQLGQSGPSQDEEERVQRLTEQALGRFKRSRELDPRSEYSYISAVELIARVVGVMARQKGYDQATELFLFASTEGWYRELVDDAETLMAELRLFRAGEAPSYYFQNARANLDRSYGNLSQAIQGWTNLLDHRDVFRPPLRRNIINAYLNRKGWDWSQLTDRETARISQLAKENLEEEPGSDQNLRMWFRAVRATGELPIGVIAEQLTYRRNHSPTIDTLYYLYIIRYLQADTGVGQAVHEARQLIEECARMAATLPHRTRSFEWLGEGAGIKALVHENALGAWNPNEEFWSDPNLLRIVTGRISRISAPAAGEVELANGLKAFFVPAKGRISGGYLSSRDIGRKVQFFLGLSYDGLRAWSVRDDQNS